MRYIRSRFGIVTWCITALLILIVPLWRLRATRQLHTSVVEVMVALFADLQRVRVVNEPPPVRKAISFGLEGERASAAVRRFPDDVSAQLALFEFKKLVDEKQRIETPLFDYASNEIYLRKWREAQPRMWKMTDAYFSRYAALQQRFPDSNLVRAQHLRDAMGGNLIADEGLQPDLQQSNASQKDRDLTEAMARERTQLWMSPQMRRAALEVALAGAKSEKENAFWPWMQAVLQFSLGQDQEALRALEAAGQCAYFDDYSLQSIESRLQTLNRLQVVGWDDEFAEWYLFWFPHNAKMRSAARAAMGRMRQSRKRGDRKTELRWAFATFRAGAVIARFNRGMLITTQVGEGICMVAWKAAAEPLGRAELKRPQFYKSDADAQAYYAARHQRNADNFMDWARLNQRSDVVRETQVVIATFGVGRLITRETSNPDSLLWKTDDLAKDYWLGAQLLILSLASALVWTICWFITRAQASQVAALRAKTLLLFMFGAGATLAILVAARALSPSLQTFTAQFIGPNPEEDPLFSVYEMRAFYPLAIGICWLILVVGSLFFSGNYSKRVPFLLLFIGLCLSFCGIASSIGKPEDSLYKYLFPISGVIFVSCMILALFMLWRRLSGRARALGFCLAATLLIPMYFVLYDFPSGHYGLLYPTFAVVTTSGFLVASLFLGWKQIDFRSAFDLTRIKAYGFQFAARARIAAGVLALLCAVAYLGIALWTIPVERQARAMMERQLQIGEVAWLREQMAVQQPLSTAGR